MPKNKGEKTQKPHGAFRPVPVMQLCKTCGLYRDFVPGTLRIFILRYRENRHVKILMRIAFYEKKGDDFDRSTAKPITLYASRAKN